jgi:RNA 3'-terminal phosphate cyclase (ATP)
VASDAIGACTAFAMVANLPIDIARREVETLRRELGWEASCCSARSIGEAAGPGNIVVAEVESDNVREVFTGFGEKGISAEAVATTVARELRAYLASDVPVGRHLADQLVLLLALAGGGTFRTLPPTQHTVTQLRVIPEFLGPRVGAAAEPNGSFRISSLNGSNVPHV